MFEEMECVVPRMSVFLQKVASESLGAALDLTLVACRSLLRV